jgi:hypothetical protein
MSNYQILIASRVKWDAGASLKTPCDPAWWSGLASRAPAFLQRLFADGFLMPWFYGDPELAERLTALYSPRGSNPHEAGDSAFGIQRASDGSIVCPSLTGAAWCHWTAVDYWFAFHARTLPFWDGLRVAGTRGSVLLEFNSECGYVRNGFDFTLPGGGAQYLVSIEIADAGVTGWTVECDRTYFKQYKRSVSGCERARAKGQDCDDPDFVGILERWGDRSFARARRSKDRTPLEMHGFESDTRV